MARKRYTAEEAADILLADEYPHDINLDLNQPIMPDSISDATDARVSLRSGSLYGITISFWCT